MSTGSDEHAPARRSRHPILQLVVVLVLFGVLLAAIVVGFLSLYKEFWSASSFAERYVEKIAEADASGALAMPGVAPEYADLEAIGRGYASETLLRSATLTSEIADIAAVGERTVEGDDGEVTEVTVSFTLDGSAQQMVFQVERTGATGIVPEWGFAESPLSVIDLTVRGAWRFTVNDFEIDKRQISPAGLEAEPLDAVSLLTFSPGDYEIAVDTPATIAAPQPVRATEPFDVIPVDIQTQPTDELSDVVQTKVEEYLVSQCTTQAVLQPSGCPFGAPPEVSATGIAQSDIVWELADPPRTALVPAGDDWTVSATSGMARLSLTVLDYYSGALVPVEREVYFTMVADVDVRDDGAVHITIDRAGDDG
ncbi:hypothetical protein [Microbacterium karelineae]|uniref:hypothetical protein n=1 Tax=Microbacterium karelineae TaxID=2654283 RepID=UPI0012E9D2D4|nr:hypothetical protein [Microbacterium karelineae]